MSQDQPDGRYRLYRLSACEVCEGRGKRPSLTDETRVRCADCRGEGNVRELVTACETPEEVGAALVLHGREGEWDDRPLGLLDTQGKVGQKWLVRPWRASARNLSDAGRTLASATQRVRRHRRAVYSE